MNDRKPPQAGSNPRDKNTPRVSANTTRERHPDLGRKTGITPQEKARSEISEDGRSDGA
jgi:hypothetical protein